MRRALFLVLACLVPLSAFPQQKTEKAVFAAGCFWCTEAAFQDIPGVVSAVSGYTGGSVKNPSYEQVSSGRTGHAEAVEVTFDPAKVSYEKLLDVFWVNHDPTAANRQFCDSGTQYRPGIFYLGDQQKREAEPRSRSSRS
jgi:peptide-methionine (S)-S-oxide reductase